MMARFAPHDRASVAEAPSVPARREKEHKGGCSKTSHYSKLNEVLEVGTADRLRSLALAHHFGRWRSLRGPYCVAGAPCPMSVHWTLMGCSLGHRLAPLTSLPRGA